ncbi:hypothetical protein AB1286_23730 [Trinickia sp. NRRL B-1857]|uniref:hypothetical protein n=1 Tax=Trinickia sp. NRRL B-1857 TaxID=3162879 RepID=UPI003D2970D8
MKAFLDEGGLVRRLGLNEMTRQQVIPCAAVKFLLTLSCGFSRNPGAREERNDARRSMTDKRLAAMNGAGLATDRIDLFRA